MFRKLARIVNVTAWIVVVVAIAAAGAVYVSIDVLRSKVTAEVDIPPGTSVAAMGEILTKARVIQTPHVFSLWARLSGAEGALKAGFYEFPAGMTLREVAEKIERGEVKSFPFTIIEGWTITDIAHALGEQPFLAGTDVVDRFLVLSRDSTFVASLGITGATSLEGYLFPDTYR
ncbi:MAG: endolytic transglycosylase MltG, partial [Deltaproteobacteria bacterium]|nr:endolytic transglycosylase MltG [Deltaproteobacteria bacterium]